MALDLNEFAELPQVSRTMDIHCVTRWTKLDVNFEGVLLDELLGRADVLPEARFVSFVARSARGHSSSMTIADALQLGTLVANRVDGGLLPAEHGGPLRGIVPKRYFYKSVKWLERIELLAENRLGFWEATAGYHDNADPWREERYMAANLDKRRARQLIESRDFMGQDLRSIDCRERDLTGLQAKGAWLRDANFSGCLLRNSDFSEANLSNANFFGADLRGAKFVNADLEGAELASADLRGADFSGCSWFGTSFCRIDQRGAFCDGAVLDRTTRFDDASLPQLTEGQFRFMEQVLRSDTVDGPR
jgi:hypothetical protein